MNFLGGSGGGGSAGGGGMMPSMNPMQGIHQMMAPLGQMLGMPQQGGEAQPAATTPTATGAPSAASANNNITAAPVGVQGLDERALIELLANSDYGGN